MLREAIIYTSELNMSSAQSNFGQYTIYLHEQGCIFSPHTVKSSTFMSFKAVCGCT